MGSDDNEDKIETNDLKNEDPATSMKSLSPNILNEFVLKL